MDVGWKSLALSRLAMKDGVHNPSALNARPRLALWLGCLSGCRTRQRRMNAKVLRHWRRWSGSDFIDGCFNAQQAGFNPAVMVPGLLFKGLQLLVESRELVLSTLLKLKELGQGFSIPPEARLCGDDARAQASRDVSVFISWPRWGCRLRSSTSLRR